MNRLTTTVPAVSAMRIQGPSALGLGGSGSGSGSGSGGGGGGGAAFCF